MKVCDRCRKPERIVSEVKIKGKNYELCEECSECTANYIIYSYQEPKGLAKLGKVFTG